MANRPESRLGKPLDAVSSLKKKLLAVAQPAAIERVPDDFCPTPQTKFFDRTGLVEFDRLGADRELMTDFLVGLAQATSWSTCASHLVRPSASFRRSKDSLARWPVIVGDSRGRTVAADDVFRPINARFCESWPARQGFAISVGTILTLPTTIKAVHDIDELSQFFVEDDQDKATYTLDELKKIVENLEMNYTLFQTYVREVGLVSSDAH